MPMIGDLQSFGLVDLLSTLGKARQSGQLSVWANGGVYRIWLHDGAISTVIPPQPEDAFKTLCVEIIDPSYQSSLTALRPSTFTLAEPLGKWLRQEGWLLETQQALVLQTQLQTWLYPLFELASGQFYFVADKVPLPYWEMSGLEIGAAEAIAAGLEQINQPHQPTELPSLTQKFLALESNLPTLRLSLLDRRLLQWFRQPNTIQSLCQVFNVEPLELQKACKRLLHLQLIAPASEESDAENPSVPAPKLEQPSETEVETSSQNSTPATNTSLIQRISVVLNKPVF
ncbi:MAG TPA: DUF4388 domain-containing protein [Stenomitos sp.]